MPISVNPLSFDDVNITYFLPIVNPFFKKNIKNFFSKTLDRSGNSCYNITIKREERNS